MSEKSYNSVESKGAETRSKRKAKDVQADKEKLTKKQLKTQNAEPEEETKEGAKETQIVLYNK